MFRKMKIKLTEGKLRQFEIFNIPFWVYGNFQGRKINSLPNLVSKNKKNVTNPVFYLKVNRDINDSILCLQQWINIVNAFNGDFYILCDNESLRKRILNNISFHSPDIKFIKSKKNIFKKLLKKQQIAPNWFNAACAHLSVFEHAKSINVNEYWNIDADDSLFLTEIKNVVEILKDAESYAKTNNIDLFSFDFWATKTKGNHWSFGITYQRNTKDYFDLLNKYFINWEDYKNYTTVHNIDWVFTFLKNSQHINAKSFYVENLYFVHFGRFISDLKNANIAYWSNGKMYWPIWSDIFKDKRGIMEIPQSDSIVKFDIGCKTDDCLDFGIKHLVKWDRVPTDNLRI